MIDIETIQEWLKTLNPDNGVAVDDGGLCLVEVDGDGKETDACLAIGGVPLPGDLEEEG